MKSRIAILCVVVAMATLVGCTTSAPAIVEVKSDPVGSMVYFDGEPVGTTPCQVKMVRDGETHYLRVSKNGFHKIIKELKKNQYPKEIDVVLIPEAESGESPRRIRQQDSGSSENW